MLKGERPRFGLLSHQSIELKCADDGLFGQNSTDCTDFHVTLNGKSENGTFLPFRKKIELRNLCRQYRVADDITSFILLF